MINETNICTASNGAMFRTDFIGIFPEIVRHIIESRKKVKAEMLEVEKQMQKLGKTAELESKYAALFNTQQALKIMANSLYGAMGNPFFRYFELQIASGITTTGQEIIKTIGNSIDFALNDKLKTQKDYVVYQDTDSCYIDCQEFVDRFCSDKSQDEIVKFLDKLGENFIQPIINEAIHSVIEKRNCKGSEIVMKREAIYSRGVWVAAKNYALVVHNSEGVQYDPPKMKVMGLALVKSSTPMMIRKKLKEALNLVFTEDIHSVRKFTAELEAHFKEQPINEIAFPRGVSDIEKYANKKTIYGSKTPIHVRGSLLFNHYNPDEQQINNGDKIRFIYLKTPNPIKENVISWPANGKIPDNLIPYIDYETQFNSVFVQPLSIILNAIDWQLIEQSSLEDFFS